MRNLGTNDIKCRIVEEELRTFWPQWHVERRLGTGAFGDVFQIYKDTYGIRVYSALKIIQISDTFAAYSKLRLSAGQNCGGIGETGKNEAIPDVFMNEIQIMEALRGAPSIVSIDDFYFQKGADISSLYVRMELLTSFQDLMMARNTNDMPFTIEEVLKIGRDICTALMYCEQRGIIHRDIKPANLFVDSFGNYKVGDFGASKRMETVHATQTMTGIGTISYMAPEIFAGRSYNNTVDIYAVGMVLYQILNNGRMPFLPRNGAYTPQEIDSANYRRLHGEKVPSLAWIRIGSETVDAKLDGIIRKACSFDSNERYRTAKDFYDALSGYVKEEKIREETPETVVLGQHAKKGSVHREEVRFGEAKAEEADINNEDLTDIYKSANSHSSAGNYQAALIVLLQNKDKGEHNAEFLTTLGFAYRRCNMYHEALECYNKAIAIRPNYAIAYSNISVIYMLQKENNKAVSFSRKAVALVEESLDNATIDQAAIIFANYGLHLGITGQKDKAEEFIKKAEAFGYTNGEAARRMAGLQNASHKEIPTIDITQLQNGFCIGCLKNQLKRIKATEYVCENCGTRYITDEKETTVIKVDVSNRGILFPKRSLSR